MSEILGAMREKYWDEKSDQEKIVILGEVVEMLSKHLIESEQTYFRLLKHSHLEGEIVIPLAYGKLETPYWLGNPLGRERR